MSSLMLINPVKRRSKRKGSKVATKKKSGRKTMARASHRPKRKATRKKSVSSVRRRYRKNPSGRGLMDNFVPSMVGGGAALGVDIALQYLPLPDALKSGPANLAARGAVAVALGFLAANFTNKTTAANITQGALTVIAYDGLKQAAAKALPKLKLGEYDEFDEMGAYLDGYESPALQLDAYLDGDDDMLADATFEDGGEFMGAYLEGELDDDFEL